MRKLLMAALFALPMFGATAMAQDTLKIGYIDPLSGGGARDRKSTRLNSSHDELSRMPSSA